MNRSKLDRKKFKKLAEGISEALFEAFDDEKKFESTDAVSLSDSDDDFTYKKQPLKKNLPMPSLFSTVRSQKRKQSVTVSKKVSKDVICFLRSEPFSKIPRGNKRQSLQNRGLVGKVVIDNMWLNSDIRKEISSLFRNTFHLNENEILEYEYLSVVCGTKSLSITKTSTNFKWNAKEVLANCGQGGIYIVTPRNIPSEISIEDSKVENQNFEPFIQSGRVEEEESFKKNNLTEWKGFDDKELMMEAEVILKCMDDDDDTQVITENPENSYENSCLDNEFEFVILNSWDCKVDINKASNTIKEFRDKLFAVEYDGTPEITKYICCRVFDSAIYAACIRTMRKITKNDFIGIKYINDDAVDGGALRRHFFSKFINYFLDNMLIPSANGCKIITDSPEIAATGELEMAGKAIAAAMLMSNLRLNCLSKAQMCYIVYGIEGLKTLDTALLLDELPIDVSMKLKQVLSGEVSTDILTDFDISPIGEIGKKVRIAALHVLINKRAWHLEQFKKGLDFYDVTNLIKEEPRVALYFVKSTKKEFSSDDLKQCFCEFDYVEEKGSNSRFKEEEAIETFINLVEKWDEEQNMICLQKLLEFITGSAQMEAPPPSITITTCKGMNPTSSVCTNLLRIPILTLDEMEKSFLAAFQTLPLGFGKP